MADSSEILMYVPIFSDLEKETIDKILSIGTTKSYPKESYILMEEGTGTAMFVIISGKVKVSRTSADGREVILSILGEYDFFGEMAILDGLSRSASVIAMSDSELFIIQREQFLDLLKEFPEISINLLQELTQRLRSADSKIKALSLKDAEGKVATVILQLAEDLGKIKQGVVEIEKLPHPGVLAGLEDKLKWNYQLPGGDDYELLFSLPPLLHVLFSDFSSVLRSANT